MTLKSTILEKRVLGTIRHQIEAVLWVWVECQKAADLISAGLKPVFCLLQTDLLCCFRASSSVLLW